MVTYKNRFHHPDERYFSFSTHDMAVLVVLQLQFLEQEPWPMVGRVIAMCWWCKCRPTGRYVSTVSSGSTVYCLPAIVRRGPIWAARETTGVSVRRWQSCRTQLQPVGGEEEETGWALGSEHREMWQCAKIFLMRYRYMNRVFFCVIEKIDNMWKSPVTCESADLL